MCEHPDPQTWADYVLCFNVKDIDLVAYSDYKFDAKMIKEKGLIEFGENRVDTADRLSVLHDTIGFASVN